MKITKKQAVLSLLYDLKDMCNWNLQHNDGILFGERLDTIIDEIENSIIEDKTIGI